MLLKSARVVVDKNLIKIKTGDDSVVYETDINSFEENSGVTIHNIILQELKAYYISLKSISDTFGCGNIFDNLALQIDNEYQNVLLIIDFDEVEEVVDSFFESYTKFLLKTSNKVITINMNTGITNQFGNFILKKINILEVQE